MFEIGASLREARIRRGLSLDDVTAGLRIRERYVRALEEERWELMPAEAYAKGFLRMYAEFLGLNGTLYIDEYNDRIALHDDEPFIPESLVPERPGHRVLFRTIVGVVAVAAAVAALNLVGSGDTTAAHVANAAPPWKSSPATAPVRRAVLPGHSLTLGLHTNVWVRIGRPQVLAIRIGSHLVGGLPGTPANLLLTRDGPRAG